MNINKVALATVIAVGLSACGEGQVTDPSVTLQVVNLSPNKITDVGIGEVFEMTFSQALDPTTVNQQNIMLMPGDSGMPGMDDMSNTDAMGNMDHSAGMTGMDIQSAIPTNVQCLDQSNCITVQLAPKMSLAYGQQYHVMVHNSLKTRSGKSVKGITASNLHAQHGVAMAFTTAFVVETETERNIEQKSTNPQRYRKSNFTYVESIDPVTGARKVVRDTRLDTDSNNAAKLTKYNSAVGGRFADVRYVDSNGSTIDRYSYKLPGAGNVTVVFDGPGGDGQWGLGNDDTIRSFTIRHSQHGTHHITESYRASSASVQEPQVLTLASLKALVNNGFEMSGANLMFMEAGPSGAPRMKKSIRFRNYGDNGVMDIIGANGNANLGSDDNVREYQVYDYDPVHGTRIGRTEYELDDAVAGSFTLDEKRDTPTSYRIYRYASDNVFGIAKGMLRVAEVTYSNPGSDLAWYYDPVKWPNAQINAEDDNAIREIELNFYCNDQTAGLYEKYEVEVKLNGVVGIGAYSNVTQFLAAKESTLANNCFTTPTQSYINDVVGLSGGTVSDLKTSDVKRLF